MCRSIFVIYGLSERARISHRTEIWDSDIGADDESGSVIISAWGSDQQQPAVEMGLGDANK